MHSVAAVISVLQVCRLFGFFIIYVSIFVYRTNHLTERVRKR